MYQSSYFPMFDIGLQEYHIACVEDVFRNICNRKNNESWTDEVRSVCMVWELVNDDKPFEAK